jgi:hypothetical protein
MEERVSVRKGMCCFMPGLREPRTLVDEAVDDADPAKEKALKDGMEGLTEGHTLLRFGEDLRLMEVRWVLPEPLLTSLVGSFRNLYGPHSALTDHSWLKRRAMHALDGCYSPCHMLARWLRDTCRGGISSWVHRLLWEGTERRDGCQCEGDCVEMIAALGRTWCWGWSCRGLTDINMGRINVRGGFM